MQLACLLGQSSRTSTQEHGTSSFLEDEGHGAKGDESNDAVPPWDPAPAKRACGSVRSCNGSDSLSNLYKRSGVRGEVDSPSHCVHLRRLQGTEQVQRERRSATVDEQQHASNRTHEEGHWQTSIMRSKQIRHGSSNHAVSDACGCSLEQSRDDDGCDVLGKSLRNVQNAARVQVPVSIKRCHKTAEILTQTMLPLQDRWEYVRRSQKAEQEAKA